MAEAEPKVAKRAASSVAEAEELPVVARLVVEIRSDGTRTVARGAIEDREHGENVGLEVSGGTPLELARSLTRAMFSLPAVARGLWTKEREAGRSRLRLPWKR